MKRTVQQIVTVELGAADVKEACVRLAGCPRRWAPEAHVEFDKGGRTVVTWTTAEARRRARAKRKPNKVRRNDLIDMTGKTIGLWKVLGYSRLKRCPSGQNLTMWRVLCTGCGKEYERDGGRLRSGMTTRCGACRYAASTIPANERFCKFCGVSTKGHKLARRCDRCDRQKARRGVCPCGKGVNYKRRACANCGRVDGKGKAKGAAA